jgi:hypothetical protein
LLDVHLEGLRPGDNPVIATITAAERDPIEPAPRDVRAAVARRLLEAAGFTVARAPGSLGEADPGAIVARRD